MLYVSQNLFSQHGHRPNKNKIQQKPHKITEESKKNRIRMPIVIGKSTVVVEHDGLTINELVGNVATPTISYNDTIVDSDIISVAYVTITEPTSEPWLTLHYDEWLIVRKGYIQVKYYNNDDIEQILIVNCGETCYLHNGERFRPIFPEGDVEYIAICKPAFSPDRCIREEVGISDVSKTLNELHRKEKIITGTIDEIEAITSFEIVSSNTTNTNNNYDVVYHMCQKSKWDDAVLKNIAYFPFTFEMDGGFIHCSLIANNLLPTANHFYKSTVGDWICIELNIKTLHETMGIVTRYEQPKPVGTIEVDLNWITDNTYPHIFGGIPTHVDGIVLNIYPMKRDANTGEFLSISGL